MKNEILTSSKSVSIDFDYQQGQYVIYNILNIRDFSFELISVYLISFRNSIQKFVSLKCIRKI